MEPAFLWQDTIRKRDAPQKKSYLGSYFTPSGQNIRRDISFPFLRPTPWVSTHYSPSYCTIAISSTSIKPIVLQSFELFYAHVSSLTSSLLYPFFSTRSRHFRLIIVHSNLTPSSQQPHTSSSFYAQLYFSDKLHKGGIWK